MAWYLKSWPVPSVHDHAGRNLAPWTLTLNIHLYFSPPDDIMDICSKVIIELGVFPSASNTMAAAMNLQLERKIYRVALLRNQIH